MIQYRKFLGYYLLLISMLILFTECQKSPISAQQYERYITAKIKTKKGTPFVSGYILGTSMYYMSDTNGVIKMPCFFRGAIKVCFEANEHKDTTIAIENHEDIDINLGVIALEWSGISLEYSIDDVFFKGVYRWSPNIYVYKSRIDTAWLYSDTLSMTIDVTKITSPYPVYDNTLKMCLNGTITKEITTKKGKAYIRMPLDTGKNELKIESTDVVPFTVILFNMKHEQRYLQVEIRGSNYLNGSNADLFLINSDGDTCSYRNKNPDWGMAGDRTDNPVVIDKSYDDDENYIIVPKLADGKYKLLAHNYADTNSFVDAKTTSSYLTILFNCQELHLNREKLLPNELWEIGEFTVPEMVFKKIDSTAIAYYP